MYSRKASVIINDIMKCVERIQSYTINLSFEEFSSEFMIAEACLYNIQVIGEAVSKLPEEVKEISRDIPWTLIKGMRNRLIHEYFGTDMVWNVIKNEPSFQTELRKIYTTLISQNL